MVDETLSGGGSAASICPWCSAEYTGEPAACPSCGAALTGDPTMDPSMPGLTAIDAAAIVRAKAPAPRQRNRLLSWISGEYPDEGGSPAEAGALAPPEADVRREMLRLELEAEVANLQAEAGALMAEAAVEGHAPGGSAEDAEAADAVVGELAAVSTELDQVETQLEAATGAELEAEVAEVAGAEAPTEEPTQGTTPV
jgi:hypothetical protein